MINNLPVFCNMRIARITIFLLLLWNSSHSQRINFAHVTDTHVGGSTGANDLFAVVTDINAQNDLDFVLITGDITEFGSREELLEAKKILDKLKYTWYALPGNHDSNWSESGSNDFQTIFGAEHFSFEKAGMRFIGTASGPNMRMAPGLVPREQIVFLDSIVNNLKDPHQKIIFVNHYPLDESLANWYKVIELLKKTNIQATLLGHGHSNHLYNFEGIPGIMGRSSLQAKQAEAGYNLVSIENDTIYYRERLSSGVTLPVWCKVTLHAAPGKYPSSGTENNGAASKSSLRPDYSINKNYPEVKTNWSIQEKSDIGTGISLSKKTVIFANAAGEIVALDLKSAKKIWSYSTGGKIYSTPAVSGNNVVCASTDHNIYCLNIKSGKLIWMYPTIKPIVASPAIENGSVYIGSSDGSFRCIRLSNGNLIWKFDSVRNFVECKPLITKTSVCFGSWGNTFYSLDKNTGTLNWTREKYNNRMLSPAAVWPVAANGKIFLVAPDRHMTALDEQTGQEIWDSAKYSCRESIGISPDGKLVYIKNMTEGNVDAFDTSTDDQKLAWECKADLGYEIAPSPIVESGGHLFVPTTSGVVVAINKKTHLVEWKYRVSDALINSILPVGKNKILVSTIDGKVECLNY